MDHLYIKNMVCDRCVKVVKDELEKLGLTVNKITLGEAEVENPDHIDKTVIAHTLEASGFELLEDKNIRLVERIKTFIIQLIHHSSKEIQTNFSVLIAKELGKDYHYLSTLFSGIENITIEKFIILQKIEKVKELLIYDELSLSEIAYTLGYSSVSHLSSQFKQVTGFTPSQFKKLKSKTRNPLDKVGKKKNS